MGEVWQHCAPRSARVLESALKIEGMLKAIIAAHGAVMPGEHERTGAAISPRGRPRRPQE
jgi:hypothetical protein